MKRLIKQTKIVPFFICLFFGLNDLAISQQICPVENASVFGGDSQNIISWDEPANPFVSAFTLELTTDAYGYETSWDLVDQFGTIVAAEPSDGDFSSNEIFVLVVSELTKPLYW